MKPSPLFCKRRGCWVGGKRHSSTGGQRERKGWKGEGEEEGLAVGSVEGPGSTRPGAVNRYFRNDDTQSVSCGLCTEGIPHLRRAIPFAG